MLIPKMKKRIYLIGNAHLDPVWMWTWQEGSAEAKATVRSALDRMKEFPEFRFTCSSASIFKWIEEFAPEMFEEVRLRVKEGRFCIVGGWYVQPDCNLPGGEGFTRQGLYSQRYFMEKFGVTATVGYDVDSFGHNAMLPQILKKSGMDSYVFMRPSPVEKEMDSNVFYWIAPDGSKVLAHRIINPYCFKFQAAWELQLRLRMISAYMPGDLNEVMFFYGVGNHGGGPTIRNLQVLKAFAERHKEVELYYASPADYFKQIRQGGYDIPEFNDDLQHHASGCYAAMSQIKTDVRRSETALIAAEKYNMLSAKLTGQRYATAELAQVWENTLFNHFHDSLGGCCIRDAYTDLHAFAGECLSFSSKLQNNALQRISWAVDTADTEAGLPIVVFNPHGFAVTAPVTVNKQAAGIFDDKGQPVVYQHVRSQTHSCYFRDDTLFYAECPAFGYRTYFIKQHNNRLKTELKADNATLENRFIKVKFDRNTCAIISLYDKVGQREILSAPTEAVIIDEAQHDTWSHGRNYFDKRVGQFGNARMTLTEDDKLRSTIRVISTYGDSILTQYYSVNALNGRVDVSAKIDWREKHKMLKLNFPCKVTNPTSVYEIPYGHIVRPVNGEEECGQMWVAIRGETNGGLALLNDNKYSFSAKGDTLSLTAIRSPIYGDHGRERDDESEYTDQGVHYFRYTLLPYTGEAEWSKIAQEAQILNTPLTHIIENNHNGTLPLSYSGLSVDKSNVLISAVKRAEDGGGLVLRAYEVDGINAEATFSGDMLRIPLTATFTPYSVNTYYLPDNTDTWKEVLMTEWDIPTQA